MLKYLESVKILHIEPTNICQAECPQCPRELNQEFNKNDHKSLTVEDIKNILPNNTIANLHKMFLCGVYGDPAGGNALEIYKHFRTVNPNIVLGMNTNGALQSTAWWSSLGKIINQPEDYVIFSLDGLEDTNHIYRKNVIWKKALSNIAAFISAGGNAHWDMLVYKHNEHQVDECEQLARHMGFKWFRAKVSRRPLVDGLEFPVNWKRPNKSTGEIMCQALSENSLYLDCHGQLHPCCWLGGQLSKAVGFEDVIPTWSSDPHPVCKATCSKKSSAYKDQWQKEIELC
jgi:sulfatase maturation enzyme AslB (radical SAM superfamily)